MSNLSTLVHLWDERPLDALLLRVHPVDHVLNRVKVNALDPLLVFHDLNLPVCTSFLQAPDLLPAGEEELNGAGLRLANTAVLICQSETVSAGASKCSVEVCANVGAGVDRRILALVIILAFLGVFWVGDVASLTVADVSTLEQIPTKVFTASSHVHAIVGALTSVVATRFIGTIPTVIGEVADVRVRHTLLVGALELVEHAGPWSAGTDGHVVLVTCVRTMLDTIAHLVLGNTLAISALELVNLFTCEVLTELRTLVCAVTAIIDFIAKIGVSHTEVVFTLMLVIRAVFSVGEPRLAIEFVGHVVAVLVAVALQLLLDAVARGTLEPLWRTSVLLAFVLIRSIATIIIVVTAPSSRNAFVVATFELRF